MPSLRLTAPGHPPTVYNLHKKITSIGSGPDNDVVLPDPLVVDGFAIHFDGQMYTVFAQPSVTSGSGKTMSLSGPDPSDVIFLCRL